VHDLRKLEACCVRATHDRGLLDVRTTQRQSGEHARRVCAPVACVKLTHVRVARRVCVNKTQERRKAQPPPPPIRTRGKTLNRKAAIKFREHEPGQGPGRGGGGPRATMERDDAGRLSRAHRPSRLAAPRPKGAQGRRRARDGQATRDEHER
jgi:hypothetical protein